MSLEDDYIFIFFERINIFFRTDGAGEAVEIGDFILRTNPPFSMHIFFYAHVIY
jgi:hypothetical protein